MSNRIERPRSGVSIFPVGRHHLQRAVALVAFNPNSSILLCILDPQLGGVRLRSLGAVSVSKATAAKKKRESEAGFVSQLWVLSPSMGLTMCESVFEDQTHDYKCCATALPCAYFRFDCDLGPEPAKGLKDDVATQPKQF